MYRLINNVVSINNLVRESIIFRILSIALFIFLFACACHTSNEPSIITVQLKSMDYMHQISGLGDLEAKKAISITAPRVRSQMLKISSIVDEGTLVNKGDVVCGLESTELETRYLNSCDEYEMAKADQIKRDAELELEKTELIAEIENSEIVLKASELNLENLKFESPNIIQLEKLQIQKSRIQVQTARRKLDFLESIHQEEMTRLDLKLKQAENTRNKTKAELDKLIIRAPANGIMEYMINWMTGEKVQAGNDVYSGMPIAKIPDLSVMQVNMMIGETEARRVNVGQKAQIYIYSMDTLHVTGTVSHKSRMAKPIKRHSKVKKVEVFVELDSCDITLAPGLTADCTIQVKGYENVLALPFECIFDKDSIKVIYKKIDKNRFVPYGIRLIHHMENNAVFESVVELPAECAMVEPPDNWIEWPKKFELPKGEITPKDSLDKPEDF